MPREAERNCNHVGEAPIKKGGENMQTINLCGRCADLMRDRYLIKILNRPINNKITCDCCKRRRYGGEYAIEPKEARK